MQETVLKVKQAIEPSGHFDFGGSTIVNLYRISNLMPDLFWNRKVGLYLSYRPTHNYQKNDTKFNVVKSDINSSSKVRIQNMRS